MTDQGVWHGGLTIYCATVRSKAGRVLAGPCFAETREAAAALVFELRPKADVASTSKAVADVYRMQLRDGGTDIRWINRRDMP